MSNRARFETKDGEHLRISRGTLTVRDGVAGSTQEHTIVGKVMFDRTSRKLHVPVSTYSVQNGTRVRGESTIVFDIARDPEQIRGESRKAFLQTETARLVNKVKSLPATLGADPSGTGGSPNPEREKAETELRQFCRHYGLDFFKTLGYKVQDAPAEGEATEKKARKKAKERRAEESVS